MKDLLVLTTSGADRVGIVDEFTARLLDFSCNIEESRMAALGGEFAMIMLVSGDAPAIDSLLAAVDAGPLIDGFTVAAKRTSVQSVPATGRPYRIESVSLDNPGIVHSLTTLLHKHNISVDGLETETVGAPFTGAPMFRIGMTVIVPDTVSIQSLRTELTEVASNQDLDLALKPIMTHGDE